VGGVAFLLKLLWALLFVIWRRRRSVSSGDHTQEVKYGRILAPEVEGSASAFEVDGQGGQSVSEAVAVFELDSQGGKQPVARSYVPSQSHSLYNPYYLQGYVRQ
jgi:hypothetical protein